MSSRVDRILCFAAQNASKASGGAAPVPAILSRLKRMYHGLPSNQRQEFLDTLLQVEKHKVPNFAIERNTKRLTIWRVYLAVVGKVILGIFGNKRP